MFCKSSHLFFPVISYIFRPHPPPPLFSREVPPGSWFNNGTSVRRAPRGAKPTEPLQGKRPATGCKGVDGWNSSGWCFFSTPFWKICASQIGIIFSKNGWTYNKIFEVSLPRFWIHGGDVHPYQSILLKNQIYLFWKEKTTERVSRSSYTLKENCRKEWVSLSISVLYLSPFPVLQREGPSKASRNIRWKPLRGIWCPTVENAKKKKVLRNPKVFIISFHLHPHKLIVSCVPRAAVVKVKWNLRVFGTQPGFEGSNLTLVLLRDGDRSFCLKCTIARGSFKKSEV